MIVSKRAKQIIDKRFLDQVDLEEIEDTEELIKFSKEDFDKEKPIMKAFNEFINEELEWGLNEDESDADK